MTLPVPRLLPRATTSLPMLRQPAMAFGDWIFVARSGLLALLAMLALPIGHALAQGRSLHNASPELKALVATPVGAAPADELHWALVLADLGRDGDALRLREWLFAGWLRQQAGEALPSPRPMEQVLTAPAREIVPTFDRQSQAVWQQVFNRHLVARLPPQQVAVPAELEALGDQLQPVGPGVWLRRDRAGVARTFYAWVELVARGGEAFPVTGFTLPWPGGGLECALPRGSVPRLLAPGEAAGLLCAKALGASADPASPAAARASAADEATWATPQALNQALAAATQGGALQPDPLWRDGVRSGVAYALANARRAEAEAWVRQHRQARADRAALERAESDARQRAKERRAALKWRLIAGGTLVGVIAAFVLLARRFGPRSAAWMLWGLGMLVCLPMAWVAFASARGGGGWGALAALIGGGALLVAPSVVAGGLYAGHVLVTDFVSNERFRRGIVLGLLALTALTALQVLIGRFL